MLMVWDANEQLIKDAFAFFDRDNDGELNAEDFLQSLNLSLSINGGKNDKK